MVIFYTLKGRFTDGGFTPPGLMCQSIPAMSITRPLAGANPQAFFYKKWQIPWGGDTKAVQMPRPCPAVEMKEAGKCPASGMVVFRHSSLKCEGEPSVGSDERRQWSQAKFPTWNHDI